MSIRLLILVLAMVGGSMGLAEETVSVQSPNGRLQIRFHLGEELRYSVRWDAQTLVEPSPLGLRFSDGTGLGLSPRLVSQERHTVQEVLRPAVAEKRAVITNYCQELVLTLAGGYGVVARSYDDGVAWRLRLDHEGEQTIKEEIVNFRFPAKTTGWLPLLGKAPADRDRFHTSYEVAYQVKPLTQLGPDALSVLPILVSGDTGPRLVVTEADIEDYPGLYLASSKAGEPELKGVFPGYPLEEKLTQGTYPNPIVTRRADYMAKISGPRTLPWRVIAVAERDGQLAESDLVYRLGGKCQIPDPSWIKPGKSTSEWLIDNNIYGVDFRSGYNTRTYEYYIDFCAEFGLEYVLFDAGWSDILDLFKITPGMDMDHLMDYARSKGVGVVLWTHTDALNRQMEAALDKFQKWGVKGIMVDFMDRDDQKMVRFYERVARETAKRHLLVDYHGAYKPDGLRARYPNAITREGFIAFEYNKWSEILTPEYEVTLPFIRMLAGPMDYEPGSYQNSTRETFRPIGSIPMSQGTRMHQVAMFVVYESPYAKFGANPSDCRREPEMTRFIARIPTVWKETRVLDGQVGDYIVTLRQSFQDEFYLGAMTDWTSRKLSVPLSFLPAGAWKVEVYEDGVNADRYGRDYRHRAFPVSASTNLEIPMAPGGGYIAHFHR